MNDDCHLHFSPLCRTVDVNGNQVNILIYKDVDCDWNLEVVDGLGNSIVCDDLFATDELALTYSNQMITTISRLK